MADYNAGEAAKAQRAAEEGCRIRDETDVTDGHYDWRHVKARYVRHVYPMEEAMSDEGWAKALMLARHVGNRDAITAAYDQRSYMPSIRKYHVRSWSSLIAKLLSRLRAVYRKATTPAKPSMRRQWRLAFRN